MMAAGLGAGAMGMMKRGEDEEGTEELKPFKHKKGPMAAKRRWAIERARKQKAGEPLGKHAEKWGVTHKNEAAARKISVREAKAITRRIIERIKKERQ